MIGSRFSDRTWIYSSDACTRNFDNGWDGRKLFGTSATPQLFAMEADGYYQINAVDEINNTELGFRKGEDSNYTLRFSHVNLQKRYSALYLIDLDYNYTVDITEDGSEYSFTAEPTSSIVKRFKIVTSPGMTTSVDGKQSELNIFHSKHSLFVKNPTNSDGKINIFDISGRIILSTSFVSNATTNIPINLQQGTYIAKAYITNGYECIQKIVVR